MATKTMFCEREKVEVLNIYQQNDKSTQEYQESCLSFLVYTYSIEIIIDLHFRKLECALLLKAAY